MLNTILAAVAAVVWSAAYTLFFLTDLRRWWRGRHQRRAMADAEREQARRAYATWVRNIPPPPSRVAVLPPALPRPAPPPARGGVVIPFPRRANSARR